MIVGDGDVPRHLHALAELLKDNRFAEYAYL